MNPEHLIVLVKLCCFSVNAVASVLVIQNFSWSGALGVGLLAAFNFVMGHGLGAYGLVKYGMEHGWRVTKICDGHGVVPK